MHKEQNGRHISHLVEWNRILSAWFEVFFFVLFLFSRLSTLLFLWYFLSLSYPNLIWLRVRRTTVYKMWNTFCAVKCSIGEEMGGDLFLKKKNKNMHYQCVVVLMFFYSISLLFNSHQIHKFQSCNLTWSDKN